MPLLNPGDPFPPLTITTTDGHSLTIPVGVHPGAAGVGEDWHAGSRKTMPLP